MIAGVERLGGVARTRAAQTTAVGVVGVLLGVIALWLALPPVHMRSLAVPIVLGALGAGAGVWVVVQGRARLGWGAVASAVVGVGGAYLAGRSSTAHLENVFVWSALVATTLRYATPLTFAALGGLFSERSGVVNIGLEGMMLMGAFFGIWGADVTGSWALGLVIAMLSGALLALVHAVFCIHLRADQIVIGTAINFLALGLTGYLLVDIYGELGTPTTIPNIPDVHLSFLDNVYFLGPAFGGLNLMIWLSFLALALSWFVLFKTPLGLRVRSVGEHPRAADTVGISVYGIRYGSVLVSGVLAALGGAYLSLGTVHLFDENLTGGRGFIALAALIFGNWRPVGLFVATLLFGFSSALADRLPDSYSASAATLFNALPYVFTIVAVAGVIGRSVPPAADGKPYKKQ